MIEPFLDAVLFTACFNNCVHENLSPSCQDSPAEVPYGLQPLPSGYDGRLVILAQQYALCQFVTTFARAKVFVTSNISTLISSPT